MDVVNEIICNGPLGELSTSIRSLVLTLFFIILATLFIMLFVLLIGGSQYSLGYSYLFSVS